MGAADCYKKVKRLIHETFFVAVQFFKPFKYFVPSLLPHVILAFLTKPSAEPHTSLAETRFHAHIIPVADFQLGLLTFLHPSSV